MNKLIAALLLGAALGGASAPETEEPNKPTPPETEEPDPTPDPDGIKSATVQHLNGFGSYLFDGLGFHRGQRRQRVSGCGRGARRDVDLRLLRQRGEVRAPLRG